MASLRVLYSFPHSLGDPGIGTTAINQVRGLAAAGHRVTVYATSLSQALPADVQLTTTMSIARLRIPHRAIGIDRAYRYHDWVVARLIESRPQKFDVLHAWPRGCLTSFSAALRNGLPSFRESPNPHTAAAFADTKRAAAQVGIAVAADNSHHDHPGRLATEIAEYAAADFILAPSEYVVDSYLERGIAPERLIRHRYGFDPVAFPVPDPPAPSRPFTAVFLGSGEPRKGLHTALEAWCAAGLGDSGCFLIAGRIEPEYRRVLAPLLERSGATELGFQRDTGAVLRRSDVLVLPSVSEGSALVTYEALASGAVPLVSQAAGSPVIDGVDGLLHPVDDVAALAAHLTRMATDPGLRASLRAAGLRRRDELSWESAGRVLAEAYEIGIRRHSERSATH